MNKKKCHIRFDQHAKRKLFKRITLENKLEILSEILVKFNIHEMKSTLSENGGLCMVSPKIDPALSKFPLLLF